MDAETIKKGRRAMGLTQRELAAMVGVDTTRISKVERGTLTAGGPLAQCLRLVFAGARIDG